LNLLLPGLQTALALLLVALVLYAAARFAQRVVGPAPVSVRWCGTGLTALWLLEVAFHALAMGQQFRLPAATALLGLAAVLAWALRGRGPRLVRRVERDVRVAIGRLRSMRGAAPWLLAALGALAAIVSVRAVLDPPLAWDSLTYHLFKAGRWVQAGGYFVLPAPDGWSIYEHFPANGEILAAWCLLPFHGDFCVNLANVPAWGLLLLSTFVLARELGASRPAAALAAGLIGGTPTVFSVLGTAYVDNGLLAALLAAFAFGWRAVRSGRGGPLALSAAGFGVALGTKILIAPAVVVGATVICVAFLFRTRRTALRAVALAGVIGASVGLPGYVRTWWLTGSPTWPVEIKVGATTVFAGAPAQVRAEAAYGAAIPTSVAQRWRDALAPFLPKFGTLGPLGLVAALLAIVGLCGRGPRPAGGAAQAPRALAAPPGGRAARPPLSASGALTIGLLAAAAPIVATYYSDRMAGVLAEWGPSTTRYVLFPFAVAVLLATRATSGDTRLARGGRPLLVCLGVFNLALDLPDGLAWEELRYLKLALAVVALTIAGGVALWRWSAACPRFRRTLVLAAPLLLVIAAPPLTRVRDKLRTTCYQSAYHFHDFPRDAVAAYTYCDQPRHPLRIAVAAGAKFGSDNLLWYPLLGRDLQNTVTYAPIAPGGELVDYADRAALARVLPAESPGAPGDGAAFRAWLGRLVADEIDVVVIFSHQPPELAWIRAHESLFTAVAPGPHGAGAYALSRSAARRWLARADGNIAQR
jgi:hypothetical protein